MDLWASVVSRFRRTQQNDFVILDTTRESRLSSRAYSLSVNYASRCYYVVLPLILLYVPMSSCCVTLSRGVAVRSFPLCCALVRPCDFRPDLGRDPSRPPSCCAVSCVGRATSDRTWGAIYRALLVYLGHSHTLSVSPEEQSPSTRRTAGLPHTRAPSYAGA